MQESSDHLIANKCGRAAQQAQQEALHQTERRKSILGKLQILEASRLTRSIAGMSH